MTRSRPFNLSLSLKQRESLVSHAQIIECPLQRYLFMTGDDSEELYLILKGVVRISVVSLEGKEIILNELTEGHLFGEMALSSSSRRTANARVEAGACLARISKESFFQFLRQNVECYEIFIGHLCDQLYWLASHVDSYVLTNAFERLVDRLFYLFSHNRSADAGLIKVSQLELSKMLSLTRESINRNIQILKMQGVISVSRGAIRVIDPDALKRLAER